MKGISLFRSIQVKLIIIYVLLILFAMQLIGVYFIKTMENSFNRDFSDKLNTTASLLSGYIVSYLAPDQDTKAADPKTADGKQAATADGSYADLNNFISGWFKVSNYDIQVIDANGIVRSAYSQGNAQNIVNQKNTQYLVSRALQNIKDGDRLLKDTDGKLKKAVAKPVVKNGKVVGAVYIVAPMDEIYNTINPIKSIFLSGTLIALALTAVLGVFLSHTITQPVKEITKQVVSVAEGRFDRRVRVRSQDEIGQLSNAFNNMTDRLKDALAVNEEEKEKLSSILANMSDGVMATDELGRVIVINRRAKQMLGVKEAEAVGRELQELLGLPQDFDAFGLPEEEYADMIMLHREQEEQARRVRVTFTPIHLRDQGVKGLIAVLQDVTEQEELEQARREFVANVSHELRTPLTTIKSYLEALEDGALEEKELAHRFVGVTRTETERMIRLVSDLLHLSRFDSKQAQMKKERTRVPDMLDEVADRFSFQLRKRRIDIVVQTDGSIREVLLDRDQIDQVLDNLVSNAVKYTADGGRIELSAQWKEPNEVEVSVKDNGVGIPKRDLDRIFDRFYRVDKARSRNMGGTGLGLSIAREIIRAHGGTISLESEYNKGTKVSFTLPYSHEESEPA